VRRFQKIHPFIAAINKNETIDIVKRLERLQQLMDRVMGCGGTSLDSVKFTISELSREYKIIKLRETTQDLDTKTEELKTYGDLCEVGDL